MKRRAVIRRLGDMTWAVVDLFKAGDDQPWFAGLIDEDDPPTPRRYDEEHGYTLLPSPKNPRVRRWQKIGAPGTERVPDPEVVTPVGEPEPDAGPYFRQINRYLENYYPSLSDLRFAVAVVAAQEGGEAVENPERLTAGIIDHHDQIQRNRLLIDPILYGMAGSYGIGMKIHREVVKEATTLRDLALVPGRIRADGGRGHGEVIPLITMRIDDALWAARRMAQEGTLVHLAPVLPLLEREWARTQAMTGPSTEGVINAAPPWWSLDLGALIAVHLHHAGHTLEGEVFEPLQSGGYINDMVHDHLSATINEAAHWRHNSFHMIQVGSDVLRDIGSTANGLRGVGGAPLNHWGSVRIENKWARAVATSSGRPFLRLPAEGMRAEAFEPTREDREFGERLRVYAQRKLKDCPRDKYPHLWRGMAISPQAAESVKPGARLPLTGCTAMTMNEDTALHYAGSKWTGKFGGVVPVVLRMERTDAVDAHIAAWRDNWNDKNMAEEVLSTLPWAVVESVSGGKINRDALINHGVMQAKVTNPREHTHAGGAPGTLYDLTVPVAGDYIDGQIPWSLWVAKGDPVGTPPVLVSYGPPGEHTQWLRPPSNLSDLPPKEQGALVIKAYMAEVANTVRWLVDSHKGHPRDEGGLQVRVGQYRWITRAAHGPDGATVYTSTPQREIGGAWKDAGRPVTFEVDDPDDDHAIALRRTMMLASQAGSAAPQRLVYEWLKKNVNYDPMEITLRAPTMEELGSRPPKADASGLGAELGSEIEDLDKADPSRPRVRALNPNLALLPSKENPRIKRWQRVGPQRAVVRQRKPGWDAVLHEKIPWDAGRMFDLGAWRMKPDEIRARDSSVYWLVHGLDPGFSDRPASERARILEVVRDNLDTLRDFTTTDGDVYSAVAFDGIDKIERVISQIGRERVRVAEYKDLLRQRADAEGWGDTYGMVPDDMRELYDDAVAEVRAAIDARLDYHLDEALDRVPTGEIPETVWGSATANPRVEPAIPLVDYDRGAMKDLMRRAVEAELAQRNGNKESGTYLGDQPADRLPGALDRALPYDAADTQEGADRLRAMADWLSKQLPMPSDLLRRRFQALFDLDPYKHGWTRAKVVTAADLRLAANGLRALARKGDAKREEEAVRLAMSRLVTGDKIADGNFDNRTVNPFYNTALTAMYRGVCYGRVGDPIDVHHGDDMGRTPGTFLEDDLDDLNTLRLAGVQLAGHHWGTATDSNRTAAAMAAIGDGVIAVPSPDGTWESRPVPESKITKLRGAAYQRFAREAMGRLPIPDHTPIPEDTWDDPKAGAYLYRGMGMNADTLERLARAHESGKAASLPMTGATAFAYHPHVATHYADSQWTQTVSGGGVPVIVTLSRSRAVDDTIGFFHPWEVSLAAKDPGTSGRTLGDPRGTPYEVLSTLKEARVLRVERGNPDKQQPWRIYIAHPDDTPEAP